MQINTVNNLYGALSSVHEHALLSTLKLYLNDDVTFSVAHPINDLQGIDAALSQFLLPLRKALPDLERKDFITVPGTYNGQQWQLSTGYLIGTFSQPLFGIPATGKSLFLRYTEMVRLDAGRVAEYYLIPDFVDAMNQAGVNPLRKSLGHDGLILPPSQARLGEAEGSAEEGRITQSLILAMLDCLGTYDGISLESMKLDDYWYHNFMWYGPAGIGTTRGIKGFRQHHQGPFLKAFPDRVVDRKQALVGKGNYAATGGWPHMTATHSGPGWLGLPPSGKQVKMRVMDIWRREGDLLMENWVGIDIIHILHQMGVDLFDQMHQLAGQQ